MYLKITNRLNAHSHLLALNPRNVGRSTAGMNFRTFSWNQRGMMIPNLGRPTDNSDVNVVLTFRGKIEKLT
jgi:hypothetical protein